MRRGFGEKRAPALPADNAICGKTRMARLHAPLEIQHGTMRAGAENTIGAARQHAGANQRLLHGAHIIAALER
jgi:hypothetical protein